MASALVGGSAFFVAPAQDADAAAGDHALKLFNIHTQKTETIVFKRNGQYDPAGLNDLNYFLRDWRAEKIIKIDPHLFDLIWQVYQESGSHDFIHVVCGYRSPPTNEMLRTRSRSSGVASHSQHMLGKAMDFFIPDVPLATLRAIGLRMQIGGVGFYPTSGSPFVHMDTGSVRHWPRMTREQLVRVFPNGHTLHIPSDGRPLPGYEEALAAYKARKASGGTIMMASSDTSSSKKSWFGKFFSKGGDDGDQEDGIPDAKAADAQARAADGQDDSAVVAKGPVAPQPAAKPASLPFAIADASIPLPRPAPGRIANPAEVADASTDSNSDMPLPRPSPVVRPVVAMASTASTPKVGAAADAISEQLAALDAKSDVEAAYADQQNEGGKAQRAAAAIAAQIGTAQPQTDSPVLAYASPTAGDSSAPHIDARSGALVGGAGSSAMRAAVANGSWRDPMAQLTPVGYGAATIAMITREGSTRQKGYAEFTKPNPFAMPHLFQAPQGTVNLGFGRIAYDGLRTDRFAGPLVRQLQTQNFASAAAVVYRQTASLDP